MEALQWHKRISLGLGTRPCAKLNEVKVGGKSSSPPLTSWCVQSPTHRHKGLEDAVEDEVPHHLAAGDVRHKPDEKVGDDSKGGGKDDPLGEHSISPAGSNPEHLSASSNTSHNPCPAATQPGNCSTLHQQPEDTASTPVPPSLGRNSCSWRDVSQVLRLLTPTSV